ncbi:succinate dehydrogenase cytochrome b subunit [Fodinibius sediminis]|jgi:succinate dehydrogenase / fumarate reductase cytochrome b subunit|uniref:Succinate dehydrogenase / fumarate reductase cytochrome b subunit n=1 Tax=Fodinibius sediminis TaxID=1214077 RepID=A0A521ESA1_9BACT|nr:succinate dehydrogenase cytochrome b subunit [Fodinibius sediminis]SMO86301.1 succinate dehydrogenase / fumarate reductase cytochrome b subunit [Fodinibius sediminis]
MTSSLFDALKSQVGRKILTGATGLGLIVFIVVHLAGNLTLFGGAEAFNRYTFNLESLGWILYILEGFLALAFILHAAIGISIWRKRRKRKPVGYKNFQSKGGPSHINWSSRSAIFTGIVLLIFLVIHLENFKFGDTQTIIVDGQQMRDLKTLVIDTFQNPWYAFGYTFVMIALGFHLADGFWSAVTSLGMKRRRFSDIFYVVSIIFAILMAIGFLFIPLYIYLTGGHGTLISY